MNRSSLLSKYFLFLSIFTMGISLFHVKNIVAAELAEGVTEGFSKAAGESFESGVEAASELGEGATQEAVKNAITDATTESMIEKMGISAEDPAYAKLETAVSAKVTDMLNGLDGNFSSESLGTLKSTDFGESISPKSAADLENMGISQDAANQLAGVQTEVTTQPPAEPQVQTGGTTASDAVNAAADKVSFAEPSAGGGVADAGTITGEIGAGEPPANAATSVGTDVTTSPQSAADAATPSSTSAKSVPQDSPVAAAQSSDLDSLEKNMNDTETAAKQAEADAAANSNDTAKQQVAKEARAAADTAKAKYQGAVKEQLFASSEFSFSKWGKRFMSDAPRTVYEAAGSTVGTIMHTLVQGILFMIPGEVYSAMTAATVTKALASTIGATQKFGNLSIKIPDALINSSNPKSSTFIYAIVPPNFTGFTNDFLATAGYIVSYDKYDIANWGTHFIGDDYGSPAKMVHLNTGLNFVGTGEPVNIDAPTAPLISVAGMSDGNTVQGYLDEAANVIAPGHVVQYHQQVSTTSSEKTVEQGSASLADLFQSQTISSSSAAATSGSLAPSKLLQNTFSIFANGETLSDFQFANIKVPFKIQEIRGLGPVNKIFEDTTQLSNAAVQQALVQFTSTDATTNANGSTYLTALPGDMGADPYGHPVADNLYVYQSRATPLAQFLLKNADSPILQPFINDYVVVLDQYKNIIPLQIPQEYKDANGMWTIGFRRNPAIFYITSLLSGLTYARGTGSSVVITGPEVDTTGAYDFTIATAAQKALKLPAALSQQISTMRLYASNQIMKGPFIVGGNRLERVDWNVFKGSDASTVAASKSDTASSALSGKAVANAPTALTVSAQLPVDENIHVYKVTGLFNDPNNR